MIYKKLINNFDYIFIKFFYNIYKYMPSHYGKSNGLQPIKKGAKLTDEQKDKLEKHKKNHSDKHIKSMRMNMLKGDSFEEAHKKAQKKVGK